MRYAIAVLVLLALATSTWAGDLSLKPETVQVSGVIGTVGAGGAAYWPLVQSEKYGASLGPIAVLGNEAAAAGIAAKAEVKISFPVLEWVNMVWLGAGYNWKEAKFGWQGGLGHSEPVEF